MCVVIMSVSTEEIKDNHMFQGFYLARKRAPKKKPPFDVFFYEKKQKMELVSIIKDGDMNYGEVYHGKTIFIKNRKAGYAAGSQGRIIGQAICDGIKEEWKDGKSIGKKMHFCQTNWYRHDEYKKLSDFTVDKVTDCAIPRPFLYANKKREAGGTSNV